MPRISADTVNMKDILDYMRKHQNVYFDYSAHVSDYDGILRKTIDRVGCDRILFGTDFP